MADIIRALTEAVEKIGLTAVLMLVIAAAAGYVVVWNKKLVSALQQLMGDTIQRNTVAANANTESNLKLATAVSKSHESFASLEETIQKFSEQWGSDPMKLCRADAIRDRVDAALKENGIICKSHELDILLRQMLKEAKANESETV